MEIATCEHVEVKSTDLKNGMSEASCAKCGQGRIYKDGDAHSVVITKIGRVSEAVVLPPAGTPLNITKEEPLLIRAGWDIVNTEKEDAEFQEKMEALSKTTTPAKIYHCKHCDFNTPDKTKLRVHYSSKHNERHRSTGDVEKEEPGMKQTTADPPERERELIENLEEQPIDRSKPENWETMSPFEKSKWYDGHKEQILVDVKEHGLLAARHLGGIGVSTSRGLFKRFGLTTTRVGKRNKERHAYFEQNKEQIIKDYYSMVLVDFLRRHHISTVTWGNLRELWNLKPKLDLRPEEQKPPKREKEPSAGILPPMPPFSDSWSMLVQIEWFKTQVEIIRISTMAEERTKVDLLSDEHIKQVVDDALKEYAGE